MRQPPVPGPTGPAAALALPEAGRGGLCLSGSNTAAGPDATVADVSYDAIGCSISVASTSILAQECIGHPLQQVMETYAAMKHMLTSRGADIEPPAEEPNAPRRFE